MNKIYVAATVVFYFMIVSIGVILLATVQLRLPGGAAFDTWNVNYQANRVLSGVLQKELEDMEIKREPLAIQFNRNSYCLGLFDTKGFISRDLTEFERTVRDKVNEGAKPESFTGDNYCIAKGFTTLSADVTYEKEVLDRIETSIKLRTEQLQNTDKELQEMVKGHQDFVAFSKMLPDGYWYQRPMIGTPYDLLILLLVMFMGALGGMVRLLRDYGTTDVKNPRPADYFFVPLIGTAVSIGGYILAKTGLLLLSSSNGETSLSPYMISLVGIVSGLLAKEVIDTIALRGKETLNSSKTAGQVQAAAAQSAGKSQVTPGTPTHG